MRVKKTRGRLTMQATAGNRVVLLGWDLKLLNDDKTKLPTSQHAEQLSPLPAAAWSGEVVPMFSPRRTCCT